MSLDLSPLNLSKEQEDQINGILDGKINPEFYVSVRDWIRQCYNMPSDDELKMSAFNEILEGYGTEAINGEWQNGRWGNVVAEYVNMGDTYIPTIINHRDEGFMVSSWGDLMEKMNNDE